MVINFQPNCTFPTATPSGFVGHPNIRSTTDVIWSCGSVIVLSTWSVLHLTVPPDIKADSKLQRIRKQLYLLGRKLCWMGIMLAFPEYLVGISTTNLFAAWVNHPQLKELAERDEVPWSLTHTILANIGGIAIRFSQSSESQILEQQDRHSSAYSELPEEEQCNRCSSGTISRPALEQHSRQSSEISDLTETEDSTENPRDCVPRAQILTESLATPLEVIETGITLSTLSSAAKSVKGRESTVTTLSEGIPPFIQVFQKSQEQHLQGLGQTSWVPFRPHLVLAVNARAKTDWVQRNGRKYNAEQIAPLHGNIWILDSKQLAIARNSGVIPRLPNIQRDEIDDKSKIDGLVRCMAVIQVCWLAVQLIARRIADQPSSALEISTVAFSACAIIIYIAEWAKPKDIGVPFYIDTTAACSIGSFSLIAEAAPITFLQARRYYMAQSCVHQVVEGRFRKEHVDRLMVLMSILSITLYGGIHLFAWNLHFPTPVESLLWKVAALTVAIAPTISALLVLLEDVVSHRTDKLSQWTVIVLAPAYLAARLYIIVESFRSLYFLPPEAFAATWIANAPHIG